ncbi:MAG: GNAT family N-acetyltransferase [Lewinellaceae bacterium]|nr:GNAT family N-acetyltransferase [Lewinellaceae bacterium]
MSEERMFDLGDGFTLFRNRELTDEFVDFLETTAFGTQQNLYRHFYIREFVADTPDTEFYYARDAENELVAIVAFCRRTFIGSPPYEGLYIRYYAASPKIRGKKLTGRLSRIVLEWLREQQQDPIIFFGSIEGRNKASRAIADNLNFEAFAPFRTTGFSRFFPKVKGDVQRVSEEEWRELLPKLDAQYADYEFWGHDYLNLHNEYYVLKKDGRIVCGAQAHPAHWVVEKMAGLLGKYVLPIIPYVPFLRNVFNPNAFHFINLEAFYVEKGHEADLVDLFESVLAIKKKHSILVWFDERDPLYQFLVRQNKLGLLSRFTSDAKATFIVDFSCYGKEDAEKLRAAKYCYPTGYDYI